MHWAARTAKDFYNENIHFDISAIVTMIAGSPVEKEFVWTMRNVGIENILLGSDYPQFSLKANVDALDRLDLTEEEKAKIRYGNAQRFFFFDGKKSKP
jgi:predicted TIM-barrel fold metal-dependent hydrolase